MILTYTLNLTINNSNFSSTTITSCNSFYVDGTTYSSSEHIQTPTTNVDGCDSTHTLNLIITDSTSGFNCYSL